MYFSIEPKRSRENLYDREEELQKLRDSVKNGRIISLYGLRRIGKTSLLQVFLEEVSDQFLNVFIDCRRFVRGDRISKDDFDRSFVNGIRESIKKEKIKSLLEMISKITISGVEIDLNKREKMDLFTFLDGINTGLEKSGKRFIIALDEVQNLRFYGKGGKDILNLLAYIYDHLTNITVILTGSEIGLLHDFLNSEDPQAPLFGRYIDEISLERFSREKSIDFLSKGFAQINFEISKAEIEKAVNLLDGIVGYLAMYGFIVYSKRDISTALEETKIMGQALVKKEIEELKQRSENYIYILKAISLGFDHFSKIKAYISSNYVKITDQTLSNGLSSLVKQGFLEQEYKESKIYTIPDPLIKAVIIDMPK